MMKKRCTAFGTFVRFLARERSPTRPPPVKTQIPIVPFHTLPFIITRKRPSPPTPTPLPTRRGPHPLPFPNGIHPADAASPPSPPPPVGATAAAAAAAGSPPRVPSTLGARGVGREGGRERASDGGVGGDGRVHGHGAGVRRGGDGGGAAPRLPPPPPLRRAHPPALRRPHHPHGPGRHSPPPDPLLPLSFPHASATSPASRS